MFHLVVTKAFGAYKAGSKIEDQTLVAAILADPITRRNVVKIRAS